MEELEKELEEMLVGDEKGTYGQYVIVDLVPRLFAALSPRGAQKRAWEQGCVIVTTLCDIIITL